MCSDRKTWPEWCRLVSRHLPSGLLPNPSFGKCFQVIEQRLNCKGLRFDDAGGVHSDLARWLVERGAVPPVSLRGTYECENTQ